MTSNSNSEASITYVDMLIYMASKCSYYLIFPGRRRTLGEILAEVSLSNDLGLSYNLKALLHFFWLQVITVFWAGLGQLGRQVIPGWSKDLSHNLSRIGAGHDFRWLLRMTATMGKLLLFASLFLTWSHQKMTFALWAFLLFMTSPVQIITF